MLPVTFGPDVLGHPLFALALFAEAWMLLRLANRSLWGRLAVIALIWAYLIALSPIIFAVLAIPPAIYLAAKRLRVLRSYEVYSVRPIELPALLRAQVDSLSDAGYRYVGCLQIGFEDIDTPLAVMRMNDGIGWLEVSPGLVEIKHSFGDRYFLTMQSPPLYSDDHYLIQPCAEPELDARMAAHQGVLDRLAARGAEPVPLSDEEVLGVIERQALERAPHYGWRDALRYMVLEERVATYRIGCEPITSFPDFEQKVRRWLAAHESNV